MPSISNKETSLMKHSWVFLWVSLMDTLMTLTILLTHGHSGEANPIASGIWNLMGAVGWIGYKFLMVLVVILICEFVESADYHLKYITPKRILIGGSMYTFMGVVGGCWFWYYSIG